MKATDTWEKMESEGWCDDCTGDYQTCRETGICQAYREYHEIEEDKSVDEDII